MTWTLLLVLALIVFFNRYVFLEPKVVLRLPDWVEGMLRYSAPCLLTAICAPIVFYQDNILRSIPADPYFISALVCILLALVFKRLLLNLLLSLLCFYLLIFVFLN